MILVVLEWIATSAEAGRKIQTYIFTETLNCRHPFNNFSYSLYIYACQICIKQGGQFPDFIKHYF